MKKYVAAAQLWGLTTAYLDMCNDIKLYKELNAFKIERNSSKAYTDSTSPSGEYMELLLTTESSCCKIGNKIVDFINDKFDGDLQKIEKGFYDNDVVDKALKIIEENYKEYIPEDKPRSEGITSEEAYSLWKK